MRNFAYDVCIVGGLGHVGLPLGISLANTKLRVMLYDINADTASVVSRGEMPFFEKGAGDILKSVIDEYLFVSTDKNVIAECRYLVFVIGTPVDKHLNPKFALFMKLIRDLAHLIDDDQHIVLRSTVYPGTTQKVQELLRSLGKQTNVTMCPERIAEGQAIEELATMPEVIGAFDDESFEEARQLMSRLNDNKIIRVTPQEAELTKLFSNVWRYIKFSIANQFYLISAANGVDYYNVHHAMTQDYPRCEDLPGAGFTAGPCLLKDTMQVVSYSDNNFFLGNAAMLINEGMPKAVVRFLKNSCDLSDKKVGILGMAFKANCDDNRESLSYKLRKILEIEAGSILCSDVYIQEEGFVSAEQLVSECDVIIVGAPHREYSNLEIGSEKILADIWNFYGKGGLF